MWLNVAQLGCDRAERSSNDPLGGPVGTTAERQGRSEFRSFR
jgi:hypothetical protein